MPRLASARRGTPALKSPAQIGPAPKTPARSGPAPKTLVRSGPAPKIRALMVGWWETQAQPKKLATRTRHHNVGNSPSVRQGTDRTQDLLGNGDTRRRQTYFYANPPTKISKVRSVCIISNPDGVVWPRRVDRLPHKNLCRPTECGSNANAPWRLSASLG